jgi:HlyD family secretion protein
VRQSEAALDLAKASVREAEATVQEMHGKLKRALELREKNLCSQEDCDTAQAAADRADAAIVRARAQVTQAQAQLDADRTELAKAVIRSPIDGIVLKRAVEPGQTVAASLQTPVLFSIAENLAQMELHVHVDEADVGQVADGQAATFTVDAFPNRSYPARITQVRYGAKQVEGVTTYETVLKVDNSDLTLRPGMTATASIVVSEISDAVLVPNAALRFTPPTVTTSTAGGGLVSRLLPRPPTPVKQPGTDNGDKTQRRVWILRNGQPEAVNVKIGGSDGVLTEVVSGDLAPDARVIVDTAR